MQTIDNNMNDIYFSGVSVERYETVNPTKGSSDGHPQRQKHSITDCGQSNRHEWD